LAIDNNPKGMYMMFLHLFVAHSKNGSKHS